MYGWEMRWELYDDNNQLVASFAGVNSNEVTVDTVCLTDGCYSLKAIDTYGDGWNSGIVEMEWAGDYINFGLPQGEEYTFQFGINQTGCAPVVSGCTNASAYNYNPEATADDGSCQTLADIVASQIFDTLCYSGPKDNRINWVIQNRTEENPNNNYTGPEDLSNLLNEHLITTFTVDDPAAQTPYAQYKNFFNIYASWWPDAPGDHTWWWFNVIQDTRDAIFLPWATEDFGWVTWFSVSKYGGGGGAGLNRERRVGDGKMWGADDYETLLHEFGHTMPGLLDEYTASGEWSGNQCWETPNTTSHTTLDSIPWRKWITDDVPLPTPYDGTHDNVVGAFEGALTNYFGCHRPTAKGCYMGAGGFGEGFGRNLCAPCIQRVICFLYRYVNVIENPVPANTDLTVSGTTTMTFSADVVAPEPNTQKYEWFLNGKLIAEDVTSVEVSFGTCDNYELKFAVTDTTDLVRYDEQFDEIYPKPYRERVWNINQDDINSYDLSNTFSTTNASCTGEQDGEVAFDISGGTGPYEVWLDGAKVDNPVTGIAPGNHLFALVDANGCSLSESITINQDALLDLQICSFYNGSWLVEVNSENYDVNSLDLMWSNGATDPVIGGLPDGQYSLTAGINGCTLTQDFELITSPDDLVATDQFFPSEENANTGSIYVTAEGGTPDYQIQWFERLGVNPTGPFVYNSNFDGHFNRTKLAPGEYRYELSDLSSACFEKTITIGTHPAFTASGLIVVQEDNCGVRIETPDPDFQYYWLSDKEGSDLLGVGSSFQPPAAGNYYVAAAFNGTNGWSDNRKGFAVTMPDAPLVEDLGNGTLAIINPKADEDYHWYESDSDCGTPVHIGTEYMPAGLSGQYYISAVSNVVYPDPIDPTTVSGLGLRMDAADLNGDGQIDDPAPPTSSILDWYFPTGNQWTENWFAYRSNYQNGLGIADWATLWLQHIDNHYNGYQTVIMAYQENALSWEETAPFEALSDLIPRHADATQLYSNDAPAMTLNGSTYLNGQQVDPLSTPNPMDFCILGTSFTNPSNQNIYWTDTHWEGKIGEILFYENALSDAEMKGVSEFLRQKWISTAELESPRTFIEFSTVATADPQDSFELSLSPNPSTDFILLQSDTEDLHNIAIYTVQGEQLRLLAASGKSARIDVSQFPAGLYFVTVSNQSREKKTLPFVKQ